MDMSEHPLLGMEGSVLIAFYSGPHCILIGAP